MNYLSGVYNRQWAQMAEVDPHIGLMCQPRTNYEQHVSGFTHWAADCGAFAAWKNGRPFDADHWQRWLVTVPPGARFVVVPDVVADHKATRELWDIYAPIVLAAGHTAAFVLQNGIRRGQVPEDAGAVFIGGDDEFKMGSLAANIVWDAHDDSLWCHMGRVNSWKRMARAAAMGCDSVDGTFLMFGNATDMCGRVAGWLTASRRIGGSILVTDLVGSA